MRAAIAIGVNKTLAGEARCARVSHFLFLSARENGVRTPSSLAIRGVSTSMLDGAFGSSVGAAVGVPVSSEGSGALPPGIATIGAQLAFSAMNTITSLVTSLRPQLATGRIRDGRLDSLVIPPTSVGGQTIVKPRR